MKITQPLIELLAIKLFEHDQWGIFPIPLGSSGPSWMKLSHSHRELYRAIARGDEPLP